MPSQTADNVIKTEGRTLAYEMTTAPGLAIIHMIKVPLHLTEMAH